MWKVLIPLVSLVALSVCGCSDQSPVRTEATRVSGHAAALPVAGDEGPPQGACPNIYYESTGEVDGTTATWTSSFGGFDYTQGADYTVTVSWSVSDGTAGFVDFTGRKKIWTPKGTSGSWSISNQTANSVDLTVNMSGMHRSVEPDWAGYIENGHFTLKLLVNGVYAKFGVNVHLEDPDEGNDPRCPEL